MREMNADDAAYRSVVVTEYEDGSQTKSYHGPFATVSAANNRKSLKVNEVRKRIEEGSSDYTDRGYLRPVNVTSYVQSASGWDLIK